MKWRYWVPGLRYFGYYDWYLKDFLLEHITLTKKVVRAYSVELKTEPSSGLARAIKFRLLEGFGFSSMPDQDLLLFHAIESAPQRTFVIVFSPVHSSCFTDFKNPEGFEQYRRKLRSFTNVVLLDWSRMNLPDDCFSDTVHLNSKGAAEFSRRLADKLKTIGVAGFSGGHNLAGAGLK